MAFVYVTASLLLATALAHVVIGWFLSKGLHDAALAVTDRPPDLGIYVRSIGHGTIELEASLPRQDIGHPGRLGLSWEAGYGYLGEVTDVVGTRIIRSFEMVRGDPPPICPGKGCLPVEVESWYYPDDPADIGLEFETVEYPTDLGAMSAWMIPASGSRWAVMVHGWTADKRELIRLLRPVNSSGLNALIINHRNDEGMPRDPSGRHRFGMTEWAEVARAVEYVRLMGATEIVLVGCSTGGALISRYLESTSDRDDVTGLIFDSPNLILAETVRHANAGLRATPLMVEFGMWISDVRWKVDWDGTNFVQRAESLFDLPTLVFHGTADATVPISVSRQLKARVPDLVHLVETAAAGHVMSWNADPDRYESYVRQFLGSL